MKNPFLVNRPGYPPDCQTCDALGRIEMVRSFGMEDLRAVLALPKVQATVRQAAERRLRKLERSAAVSAGPAAATGDHEVIEFQGQIIPVLGAADCTGDVERRTRNED